MQITKNASNMPIEAKRETVKFKRITSSDLAQSEYSIEFLIEGAMVAGQPMIIAGPPKSLKTTCVIDAAISLASGTPMLGHFKVPRAVSVAVMTGESGLETIQETARRIATSKGLRLEDQTNLIWSDDLPKFGDPEHMEALQLFLVDDLVEVLIIDPAYLCMPGDNASNLMCQGELLGQMAKTCSQMGVTLVIAHHTKKHTAKKRKQLDLTDIACAGFPEFARQWWMINHRERYEEGSGTHKLWLSIGGSAGHSALWGVDANEGIYNPTELRHWDVTVQRSKSSKPTTFEANKSKLLTAMADIGSPESLSQIAKSAPMNYGNSKECMQSLVVEGRVKQVSFKKGKRYYKGWEINQIEEAAGVNALPALDEILE